MRLLHLILNKRDALCRMNMNRYSFKNKPSNLPQTVYEKQKIYLLQVLLHLPEEDAGEQEVRPRGPSDVLEVEADQALGGGAVDVAGDDGLLLQRPRGVPAARAGLEARGVRREGLGGGGGGRGARVLVHEDAHPVRVAPGLPEARGRHQGRHRVVPRQGIRELPQEPIRHGRWRLQQEIRNRSYLQSVERLCNRYLARSLCVFLEKILYPYYLCLPSRI